MKGIHALHFLKLPSMAIFPWGFDHFISEIADEKQHLENPAALPPTPVAAKPPLRFQSLPNLSSFSNLISIPYIDETVRFC